MSDQVSPPAVEQTRLTTPAAAALAGLLVYLLLVGVGLIGDGFKLATGGAEGAQAILSFASEPLVAVILGILATALVQSSSTVTSVIVGLVAGGMPLGIAIPMILGANMGTTVTNTLVSLGSIRDSESFQRAFQAATVHDFFNLFAILVFLPIEVLFSPLEYAAGALAALFAGAGTASLGGFDPIGSLTDPVVNGVMAAGTALPTGLGGTVAILIGIVAIVISVHCLGVVLRTAMHGRAERLVRAALGRGKLRGVASGALVTVLVQSSSTTTSLVVPLAGANVLSTREIFPFTLGANIGTTVTALLAATAVSGPYATLALQIALVHLLFNTTAVAIFLAIPWLRDVPVSCAEWLGERVRGNRAWGPGYVAAVFFGLPGIVLGGQWL